MAADATQPVSADNIKAALDALEASFDAIYGSISGTLASLQDQIDQLKEEASKPVVLWSGKSDTATVTGRLSDYSTLTIEGACGGTPFSGVIPAEVGGVYVDYADRVYAEVTSTGTSFTVEVRCLRVPIVPATMTSISGSKNI